MWVELLCLMVGIFLFQDIETHAEKVYDIVIHDVFSAGPQTSHLMTREVFDKIKHLLKPHGILVFNIVGAFNGQFGAAPRALARTLKSIFKTVKCYKDSPLDDYELPVFNLVFFCSESSINFVVPDVELDSLVQYTPEWIAANFQNWEIFKRPEEITEENGDNFIITDKNNPLNELQKNITQELWRATKTNIFGMN